MLPGTGAPDARSAVHSAMAPAPDPALVHLADLFEGRPAPVLAASARALARLAAREESVNPREVAQAVLRDPLLALGVLRYLATHHSSRMLEDIAAVEHAVMMIGVARFFAAFAAPVLVEDALAGKAAALAGVLDDIRRARAASLYAGALASLRADPAPEQVALAALLRDFAGLLLACHPPAGGPLAAPERAILECLLARRWGLPELTLAVHDEAQAGRPRVQLVAVAGALAGHVESGWHDAGHAAVLASVTRLAGCTAAEAGAHVFDATLRVIGDRIWYGPGRAPLPLPPLPAHGGAPADASQAERAHCDLALRWLDALGHGLPLRGHPRGGLLRDARHDQLAAAAALMHGMTAGCGCEGGLILVPEGGRWRVLYRAGTARVEADEPPPGVPEAMAFALAGAAPGSPDTAPAPAFLVAPVFRAGAPCAAGVALAPRREAARELAERARALAAGCEAALAATGAAPFWNSRTGS